MSFHPEKCEVIHITTKKYPIIHKYTLHGHTLLSVPQIKYLGVQISQDLKWNSHINSISSKANQTLGFLKRDLKINSQTIKEKAYKSIARPKLKYCSTVWDPKCILKNPKEGDKTKHRLVYQLEMVQMRAARWVTGRYHNTSSVSDMLRGLDWRSLQQRRVDSRLTILYKIRNHLVAIDENLYLQRGTGRREYQYRQLRADKTTHAFPSSPGQSYSGTSYQVKSAKQSNSIPSRLRPRGSSTLDSFSLKHFFYLFCLFLPLLPSAFPIFSSTLPHLLRYFYYHFPSCTPLVLILIVEGIPVYRQKQCLFSFLKRDDRQLAGR